LAAYSAIAWWKDVAGATGSCILPVFTTTTEFVQGCVRADTEGLPNKDPAAKGAAILKRHESFPKPDDDYLTMLMGQIRNLYKEAYGTEPIGPEHPGSGTVRSLIRTWITMWDLHRYDASYKAHIQQNGVPEDTQELGPDDLAGEEEVQDSEE
ncbi:MAG: hypothetical protein ACP5VE_15010, partial [Chthonomonadales bacterium]